MHAGDKVLSGGGDGNDALQGGGNDVFDGGGEDSVSFANFTGHVWAALGPHPRRRPRSCAWRELHRRPELHGNGGGVDIGFGGNTLTLAGYSLAQLSQSDFVFG